MRCSEPRRALLATLLLAVAQLGGATGACAQDDDGALRSAVRLFEASEELYNQGEFAEAADLLRRAYDLHPNPTLLFNLARAQEGLGELDAAIETYERYLAEAEDIPDRGAIERRVQTLRDQRDRLAAEEEPEERGPPEEAVTDDPSEEAAAGGGGGDPIDAVPWVLVGTGLATVGAGIVLGVLSQDQAAAARDEPVQERAVAQHEEAQSYALVANVLFAVGGALALAGGIWGVVTLVDGDDGERVEAAVLPGGISLRGRL